MTKKKSNNGIVSITFALEVLVDAAGIKTYLLREPRTGQPLTMTTESPVLIDAVDDAVESYLKLREGVRQG